MSARDDYARHLEVSRTHRLSARGKRLVERALETAEDVRKEEAAPREPLFPETARLVGAGGRLPFLRRRARDARKALYRYVQQQGAHPTVVMQALRTAVRTQEGEAGLLQLVRKAEAAATERHPEPTENPMRTGEWKA